MEGDKNTSTTITATIIPLTITTITALPIHSTIIPIPSQQQKYQYFK